MYTVCEYNTYIMYVNNIIILNIRMVYRYLDLHATRECCKFFLSIPALAHTRTHVIHTAYVILS